MSAASAEDAAPGGDDAPPSLEGRDWREVRAVLQAGGRDALVAARAGADRAGFYAFPLALPEVGCCLASHPAYYRRNKMYLTQSVVFVTSHDDKAGSAGLVLNRPLSGTAAALQAAGVFGRSCDLASTPLATAPVYLGGSDALGDHAPVAVIHPGGADVEGALEPLTGVYTSSVDRVLPLIECGAVKPGDVRLFSGCIRWAPGELRAEVEAGEWFAASASAAFPLSPCIGLPTPLWRELMVCMSPVHEQIARQVFGDDAAGE